MLCCSTHFCFSGMLRRSMFAAPYLLLHPSLTLYLLLRALLLVALLPHALLRYTLLLHALLPQPSFDALSFLLHSSLPHVLLLHASLPHALRLQAHLVHASLLILRCFTARCYVVPCFNDSLLLHHFCFRIRCPILAAALRFAAP